MKNVILSIILSAGTTAAADVPKLMRGLVDLRADLESLNREVESSQKENQAELDMWVQKKLELESALQRESLRQMQLTQKTNRLTQRVKAESKTNPQARREFQNWIDLSRGWINSSLPFRREHRLQTVRAIEERAQRGLESLESLAAELWMFYEGELKMAADNEFKLVDSQEVVRLGMFTMFTRNARGEINKASLAGGEWTFLPVAGSYRADAERLFQNMKAKKEFGLYNLPIDGVKEVL